MSLHQAIAIHIFHCLSLDIFVTFSRHVFRFISPSWFLSSFLSYFFFISSSVTYFIIFFISFLFHLFFSFAFLSLITLLLSCLRRHCTYFLFHCHRYAPLFISFFLLFFILIRFSFSSFQAHFLPQVTFSLFSFLQMPAFLHHFSSSSRIFLPDFCSLNSSYMSIFLTLRLYSYARPIFFHIHTIAFAPSVYIPCFVITMSDYNKVTRLWCFSFLSVFPFFHHVLSFHTKDSFLFRFFWLLPLPVFFFTLFHVLFSFLYSIAAAPMLKRPHGYVLPDTAYAAQRRRTYTDQHDTPHAIAITIHALMLFYIYVLFLPLFHATRSTILIFFRHEIFLFASRNYFLLM